MDYKKAILLQAQSVRNNQDALARRPDLAYLVRKIDRAERMNEQADAIIEKLAAVKGATKASAANIAILAEALIFLIKFLHEQESED